MRFLHLEANGIMGCNYELDFDPNYTVIIGKNRQGKTLAARLIMLALYGLQTPKELHESWKLRSEELLPYSEKGFVELQFENQGEKYKILRKFSNRNSVEFSRFKNGTWDVIAEQDRDAKEHLEDEIRITPGLMNVVMSNEEGLIGSLFYDDELQADVWQGWRWKTEIIRDNLKKARNKCGKEANNRQREIKDLEKDLGATEEKFIDQNLFSEEKINKGLTKNLVDEKIESIDKKIDQLDRKATHYSNFYQTLVDNEDLSDPEVIKTLIETCAKRKEQLDESDLIDDLQSMCDDFSSTLEEVNEKGGKKEVEKEVERLQDELKKLQDAKGTSSSEREEKPLHEECTIYPPEEDKKLTVEIPSEVAEQFEHAEMSSGSLAVPYDPGRESEVEDRKQNLEELLENFEKEKEELNKEKISLRKEMGERQKETDEEKQDFQNRKTILNENIDDYLEDKEEVARKEKEQKKLEKGKRRLKELRNALEAEESLKKIRQETVKFINQIYQKSYGWDILAELEDEDKIIVTDERGNVRSHPSGSEIHIMGMSWRWMVARSFDLPLVLDELDALLDSENYKTTRRIIEEKMDRQILVLTLQEDLQELPGEIYRIKREDGDSTLEELH